MPVIINELEVIAQPPNADKVRESIKQGGMNLPGPTPLDLQAVLLKFIERRQRLQAR